jgi:hypothetical protein
MGKVSGAPCPFDQLVIKLAETPTKATDFADNVDGITQGICQFTIGDITLHALNLTVEWL